MMSTTSRGRHGTSGKRLLVGLLAAAVSLVTTLPAGVATPAHADGLLPSDVFDGWQQAGHGGAQVGFRSSTDHTEGQSSLKIVGESAGAPGVYSSFAQQVAVEPSTSYVFTAQVRSDGLPADAVQMTLSPDWAVRYSVPSGTYGWTPVTWTYTTGSTETTFTARFLVQAQTAGVWIDQLTMSEQGGTANLLTNGGFESQSADVAITNPTLVFGAGQTVIDLVTRRAATGTIAWSVTANGVAEVSGTTDYVGSTAAIVLAGVGPGFYDLDLESTAGGVTVQRHTTFAVVDATVPADTSARSPFGVGMHLGSGSPQTANLVDTLAFMGVRHARTDVDWATVERQPGVYTFPAGLDTDIAELVDSGIRPLLISSYRNPFYDDNRTPSTPAGLAGYASYSSAILAHYGPAAVDLEVYNEFDWGFNDGLCGPTPECYQPLLEVTATTVRGDHDAVLSGPANSGPGIKLSWLDTLFALGGLEDLDAVSIHPYQQPNAPEGMEMQLDALRQMISDHGSDAPIWTTEIGWATHTGGGVSDHQAAQYLVRSLPLSLGHGVTRYYWYDAVDDGVSPSQMEANFGLFEHPSSLLSRALAPKPAAATMAVAARELAGVAFSGIDDLAEGVCSYRFSAGAAGDERTTRMMWSPNAATVQISADGPVEVVDLYGHTRTVAPISGVVTLDLIDDPVYVSGAVTGVS